MIEAVRLMGSRSLGFPADDDSGDVWSWFWELSSSPILFMDGNPFSGEVGLKIPANGRRIGDEAWLMRENKSMILSWMKRRRLGTGLSLFVYRLRIWQNSVLYKLTKLTFMELSVSLWQIDSQGCNKEIKIKSVDWHFGFL